MLIVDQYHSILLVNLSCFRLPTKQKGIRAIIKVNPVLWVVLLLLQSTAVYGTVGKPGGYSIDLAAPTTNIQVFFI